MTQRLLVIALMLYLVLTSFAHAAGTGYHKVILIREQPIGTLPPGVDPNACTVSPDGRLVAGIAPLNDQKVLWLNGTIGTPYDDIQAFTVVFSPDSRHLAYKAFKDGKVCIVRDGQEDKSYDSILEGTIQFSPDSQHLLYIAKDGAAYRVVLDSREGTAYQTLNPFALLFSPDSQHVAYAAWKTANQACLVYDGQVSIIRAEQHTPFDDEEIRFSDGSIAHHGGTAVR